MGLSASVVDYEVSPEKMAEEAFANMKTLLAVANASRASALNMIFSKETRLLPNPWYIVEGDYGWGDEARKGMRELVSAILGFEKEGKWFAPSLFSAVGGIGQDEVCLRFSVLGALASLMSSGDVRENQVASPKENEIGSVQGDSTWFPIDAREQPSVDEVVEKVRLNQIAKQPMHSPSPGLGGVRHTGTVLEDESDEI